MKRLLFVMMFTLASCCLFAAAVPVAPLWTGLVDNNGQPLSSGLVYFYVAGTGTAKTVWHDSGKASAWTQPVVLDAYGRAQVFADGVYKLIVADSASNTLITFDGATYLDPSAATTSTFVTITATNGTIGSFTSPGATLSSATISASTFTNGNINGSTLTSVTLASPTINNANLANASASTDLNMNLHKITNLATPSAATDGVNKGYSDVQEASYTSFLNTQVASITSFYGVPGTDYSAVIESVADFSISSGTSPAAGAAWVPLDSFTIVNSGTVNRVYFVNVGAQSLLTMTNITVGGGTDYASFKIGLIDGSGNVYDMAAIDLTNQTWASDTLTISNIESTRLTGLVNVASGSSRTMKIATKSYTHGTDSTATVGVTDATRWYSYFQVK